MFGSSFEVPWFVLGSYLASARTIISSLVFCSAEIEKVQGKEILINVL